MFISCLHCRDLVAIDPITRLPPIMCPRCGGDLQAATESPEVEADTGRSFASFLQPTGEPLPETASAPPDPFSEDAQDDAQAAAFTSPAEPDLDVQEPLIARESAPSLPAETAVALGPSPSFIRPATATPQSSRSLRWQWVALVALALLLLLQTVIADRARLAADPQWRPLLTQLCGVLGCALPEWREPQAFNMLSRDVRPLPGAPGNLQVEATFRNDAQWPQAWPQLMLTFSDADGRVVGARAFTPAEYLGKADTQPPLAPGQSAHIGLRLREPGPDAVAFSFDFR